MFQKFNTTTLKSNLIKGLLANTSIPIWKCILIGDYIIRDNFYIFRNFVIKCTESGYFSVLDLSAPIITHSTEDNSAAFEVISTYNNSDKKYNYNYLSSYNYYDDQTHYHLGKYLSYLECTQDLNLFPFYNCYTGKTISGFLEEESNKFNSGSSTNILHVTPINFNTEYTITYSSRLNSKIYCITDLANPNVIQNSIKYIPPHSFNKPIKYSLESTDSDLLKCDNQLYLIIELTSSMTTSIVVLKGDYTRSRILPTNPNIDSSITYPKSIDFSMYTKPSLLLFDSKSSYAFSNTLIEFLLTNAITQYDPIYKNITRLQKAFNILYGDHYTSNDYGNWSPQLEIDILKLYKEFESNWNCVDRSFTGITIVEEFLTRKGIDLDVL